MEIDGPQANRKSAQEIASQEWLRFDSSTFVLILSLEGFSID